MQSKGVFKKGLAYPYEGFIQQAIENYFTQHGFEQVEEDYSDYVCFHPVSKEKWVIEAKGKTEQIGLDFRTCLGQVVQRMDAPNTKYAIAVPNLKNYINQCKQVKQWVRKALNLHLIVIDSDGNAKIFNSEEKI